MDRRISNRLEAFANIQNKKTKQKCPIAIHIDITGDDNVTQTKVFTFELDVNHKHINRDNNHYLTVEFNSTEDEQVYKIANQGAGLRLDIPGELKSLFKLVYFKYTGNELPDGAYYIPETFAIIKFRNMLTNQPDVKNNI